ncbi:hypothetical protein [Bradyrhizobium uaiense]|uniref:Uncharacterized protein n=1 Tax=Bradyrhizobium uaiense TaxID=2594946 RepID=A0A6P1BB06_9BRAD|nr:hypothetical protein [Bradyrhizobium uaiense]NEU94830.1 hypothetical protein [Bradyrhizobium uaiense]
METSTVVAIVGGTLAAVVSVGSILTFWMNFSNRIVEAKSIADAATKQASGAVSRAITLEKELTDLRVEVARDYVSKDTLGALEKRVIDAINALGTRIDGLVKSQH